jgi:NAD+ kinase
VRCIGVAVKPSKPETGPVVRMLVQWLRQRGHTVALDEEAAAVCPDCEGRASRAEVAARADLMVVLGGDGTLLSVARDLGGREVPILGVNLGGLGFLTEIALEELLPTLEQVLRGEGVVSRRLTLTAEVRREGRVIAEMEALNDAVINKTTLSRILDLETLVNGEYVTTFRSDGLIVATPTGSTAYCLSAGGPILYPTLPALVIIPICPHTLTNRPLVIPVDAVVEVIQRSASEDVHLTVDGQVGVTLQHRDVVALRRSPHTIALIRSPKLNYFDLLRAKLRWGER